jgi:hypothetical protein
MLSQEREHTARRYQMTDQRRRIQQLPVTALYTLHPAIFPYRYRYGRKTRPLFSAFLVS